MISSARNSFIVAFAEELKRAREFNQITLGEVASATRVKVEFLYALEAGHWEDIPQPYLRGYLSLYARAAGMNSEKVLASYDMLLRSEGAEGSAVLDSSRPLLGQPEQIGVTRAKIRTSWFTTLTRDRKTGYLVLGISVILIGMALLVSRRSQRPAAELAPFDQSIAEYRETTHGPRSYLGEQQIGQSESGLNMIPRFLMLRTIASGVVVADYLYGRRTLHYMPYDTVLINTDSLQSVVVYPVQSGSVRKSRDESLSPLSVVSDSAFYSLASLLGPVLPSGSDSAVN